MESNSSVLVGVCCYYHSFWSSKFVATPGSSSNQLSCGINLHSNPQVKIEKTTCFEYHGGNKQFLFLGGSPSFFVQFRSVSAMIYVLKMVVTTVFTVHFGHLFWHRSRPELLRTVMIPGSTLKGPWPAFFSASQLNPAEGARFKII